MTRVRITDAYEIVQKEFEKMPNVHSVHFDGIHVPPGGSFNGHKTVDGAVTTNWGVGAYVETKQGPAATIYGSVVLDGKIDQRFQLSFLLPLTIEKIKEVVAAAVAGRPTPDQEDKYYNPN